jgi:hypothetical protein
MPKTLNLLLVGCALSLPLFLPEPAAAQFSLSVSVNVAPPALPVYAQPPIPGDGYYWTPGYWAWNPDVNDYYWVPGTWIEPPQVGLLWTPGYWAMEGAVFGWHTGYWGPQIGFYGGVAYGYGYDGVGYGGGYWQNGHLFYNRSVNNISNVNVTNVYNKTVVNNVTVNNVSYNGGSGGTTARPTSEQLAAAQARHVEATSAQRQQVDLARNQPTLQASKNGGHPPIAATSRPGEFRGGGVVAANQSGPTYHPNGAGPRAVTAPPPAEQQRAPDRMAPPADQQRAPGRAPPPAEQQRAPERAPPPAEQQRAPDRAPPLAERGAPPPPQARPPEPKQAPQREEPHPAEREADHDRDHM